VSAGTWKHLTDSVNSMASNLTGQVRNIAEVATAGGAGRSFEEDHRERQRRNPAAEGTINTMVDQLNSFAGEVTRVAREVGTEGRLGGQAQVSGVAGTWKDLTDSVNSMAGNLTGQVRNIAEVATAIATGDLVAQDHRRRARRDPAAEGNAEHHGGSAELLRRPKSRAWRAKSAPKGRLGGQAQVPGVAGTWKDLTDNVNSMAGNLDRPSAQHRRSDHRGGARRPCRARSPST
jgi:HAMP domain-containing protein